MRLSPISIVEAAPQAGQSGTGVWNPSQPQQTGNSTVNWASQATPEAEPKVQQQPKAQQPRMTAQQALAQIRADHFAQLTIDQKINLALQKAGEGEKVAYKALRDVSLLDRKLDQIFKNISAKLPQEPHEHGTSIFDDDGYDPESILGY